MHVSQAKDSLEKIIRHFKTLDLQTGQLSALDRDLMLGYIRSLYDAVLSENPTASVPKAASAPTAAPKTGVAEAFERPVRPTPPPAAPEPIVVKSAPAPPPPPAPEPIVVKPAPAPPPPAPEPVPVQPEPIPEPVVAKPVAPKPVHKVPTEVVALFEVKQSKELADRLSETPLADINKGLSLNDRLVTVNQLFDNDKAAFDDALRSIQGMSGYFEARDYLIENFAVRLHWADEEKSHTAKTFIKLVRRKFL